MATVATRVGELLELAASSAKLQEISPALTVTAAIPSVRAGTAADADGRADQLARLAREGLGGLRSAASADLCARLAGAIEALRARELPATFVYAFDDAWSLGESVRQRVSAFVGHDYALVEDVWAWLIAPGSAGWPAHRGLSHVVLDREAPEVLNVWVALTDVTADRACMHAVPLVDDPGYPGALDTLEIPPSSARPMPVGPGDALFWNANVLHWGGRCALEAAGPRISASFTLCRADATARFPELTLLRPLAALDLTARMDAVARMVLVYGGADRGDVSKLVREWATITRALTARFGPT